MRRLIGSLLVLHGFAHAGAGVWATPGAPYLLVTLLWWVAMVGFVSAGAGLIGAAIDGIILIDNIPEPSFASVTIAPLGLLVYEPAHFIMQRSMLLGIRDRAEQARRLR